MLKILERILDEELIAKYSLPFRLKNISNRFSFKFHGSEEDFNISFMDTEKYTKWTEIIYWIQLIEYDLICIHSCLTYLNYSLNVFKTEEKFLENTDIYFFFDSSVSKYITLLDRISQLANSTFSLGLIENRSGALGVSLKNVQDKLDLYGLFDIKECISKLVNFELKEIKKIRNAITHHYHPMNRTPILEFNKINGIYSIDPIIREEIAEKELMKVLINSFSIFEDVLIEFLNLIKRHFRIRCIIVRNKLIVGETYLEVDIN